MPANKHPVTRMELLPPEELQFTGPGTHCQDHWYAMAGRMMRGDTVLDAGAGTGYGLGLLREMGVAEAVGFDYTPRGPGVEKATIDTYGDDSWDWVVGMDVIEHVQDDKGFLAHMIRIARKGVMFTTPNWNKHHCANSHHFREYTPVELQELLKGHTAHYWMSDRKDQISYRGNRLSPYEQEYNFGVLFTLPPHPLPEVAPCAA